MIRIRPIVQRHDFACGVVCMQMVLEYYGIRKSERQLIKLCKSNKIGTTAKNMVECAKKLGLEAYYKDNTSYEELVKLVREGIPVIFNWFIDGGHYSIAVSANPKGLEYVDPSYGRYVPMKKQDLLDCWFDFETDPPSHNSLVLRRMIVIKRH